MLALKSAVKFMSETKLLALITTLRMVIVPMFIMIVLGLAPKYNNELTFQIHNLAFQMPSRNTLSFNIFSYPIWVHMASFKALAGASEGIMNQVLLCSYGRPVIL